MRISDWSSDVCSSDLKGGAHQTHQGDREKAFLSERVVGLGHAPSLSPPRWRINSASAPWPVASTPAITRPRSSVDLFCDSLIVGRHAAIRISKPTIAPVILLNSAGFILARVDRKSTRLNSSH